VNKYNKNNHKKYIELINNPIIAKSEIAKKNLDKFINIIE